MDFEGIDKPIDGSTRLTMLSRRHQTTENLTYSQ